MYKKSWQLFSHGADIGVRGCGNNLTEAYEMAAIALTSVITDIKKVKSMITIAISCDAPDKEILFLDWLNAIIYEMSTRKMLFSKFDVHIEKLHLNALLTGELIDQIKHQPAVEAKGATLTELKVKKENNYWIAQCVIDV